MKKEDIDIKSIRAYQAVSFESKLDTFFSVEQTPNRAGCKIEIVDGIGVLLSTAKDSVIVPFTNISGMYLQTEYKTQKEAAHRADINKPAKAQSTRRVKSDPIGAKS